MTVLTCTIWFYRIKSDDNIPQYPKKSKPMEEHLTSVDTAVHSEESDSHSVGNRKDNLKTKFSLDDCEATLIKDDTKIWYVVEGAEIESDEDDSGM